ncbi:helix-turn-helix domain-containing protein [Leuconostoc gasicomitatum]|uniref:helix-turn-helix domain-containing protein n=1 Tax=Leuconostoc gasicomitatum TaxID=115778 RepID=UPI000BC684B3|nr:helix-turn-helix domain-containing protein [Leuconostoc gasicomitatum]MBZ5952130.1 helix-turn-helix domain-containing protein [Leuconostoc gasicomitatum]MBZ5968297.1 helix-turn-helix domain-containing protein [Leuconostoc gasicomitatum]SOC01952.1 putative transcriptional regulator [Leuconostoc gasicomitatum]
MSEILTNQIGEQLKAARLKKNLSLDDVQTSTKIQERYLEAIENNNLGILPGDFYVRAFIRQYALAVDLNPEDLLGEAGPASISRSKDLNRAHRDNDGVVRAGIDTTRSAKSQISSMLPTIWIGIIVFLVLVGIWFVLTHLNTGSQQSNDGSDVSISTSTVPNSTSSSESNASSSSRKKTTKKNGDTKVKLGTPEQNVAQQTTIYNLSKQSARQHTIKINAQNTGTNVQVTADGNVILNEVITADKTITVPEGTSVVNVQFTNVANAVMTFDSQRVNVISTATPFWNVLMNLNN